MTSCAGLLEDDRLGTASNDPRQQLEELNSKIARLEVLLEQLKGQRFPLKRQINQLCAPVLRLPPELSFEIFLAYLPRYKLSPQKELAHTPLAFGRVCSDWRNQAWSMPLLWKRICVDLSDRCTPMVSVLLEEWLVLSRDHPLSIDLQCAKNGLTDVNDPNITAITAVIASFCERWQSITFSLPSSLFRAFRCVEGRLPLLTSMGLYITDSWHVADDAVRLFNVAPRLRKAHLLFKWNGPVLPMTQLTYLEARPRDFGLCLDILRSSPCLVDAHFAEVCPSDVTMLAPVTAPQLRSLDMYIERGSPGLISGFLNALTLPFLRTLALRASADKSPLHASLISLINRSSCSLTDLTLGRFSIPAEHIIECFRTMPSVTSLQLTWMDGVKPNDIIWMLDPSRISQPGPTYIPLPNLRELFVTTGGDFDWTDVANMLVHRWKSPTASVSSDGHSLARLCSFTVNAYKCNHVDEHAANVIKGLKAQGMEIRINILG